MNKLFFAFIVFILSSQLCLSGEMYKWVDKNGVTRFTNTAPPSDAQKVGKETDYVAQPITPDSEKPDYLKYNKPTSKEIRDMDSSSQSSIKSSTPSEYKIRWSSPRLSGDDLSISGQIEGGEKCKSLTVDVSLYDEKGNVAHIVSQVNDVGGSNSRIIDGKRKTFSFYGSDWKVKSHRTACSG